jgi:hypothetical protein
MSQRVDRMIGERRAQPRNHPELENGTILNGNSEDPAGSSMCQ